MKKSAVSSKKMSQCDLLKKQVEAEPQDSELRINYAEALLNSADATFEQARQQYEESVEIAPSSYSRALYWEWLGTIEEGRGNYSQAVKAYLRWAEYDGLSIEPIDRLAVLYKMQSQWMDLLHLHAQYIDRTKLNPTTHALESLALYSFVHEQISTAPPSEDEDTSSEIAQVILNYNPYSITLRYLLGVIYTSEGHIDGAISEFNKVLELDEGRNWQEKRMGLNWNSAGATMYLGRIARAQGRNAEAINYFAQCLSLGQDDDPEASHAINMEALEEMCSLLIEDEHYEDVLEMLGQEELNETPWIRRVKARALLGQGKISEAAELFQDKEPVAQPEEEDQQPSQPDFKELSRQAEAIAKEGDPQKAIELLEELARQAPANRSIWIKLYSLYKAQNMQIKCRLASLQLQAILPADNDDYPNEWLAPAIPGNGILAIGISARRLPGEGSGKLTVTGLPGAQDPATVAWNFLRAEHAENLNQSEKTPFGEMNLDKIDMHVHVRNYMSSDFPILQMEDLPNVGPQGDVCNEDIGLAVLLAITSSLLGIKHDGNNLAAGSLDLLGGVYSSTTLTEAVSQLYTAGFACNRVFLPRTIKGELDKLPSELWTDSDIVLCGKASHAIRRLQE